MARPRSLPDADVFSALRHLLAAGGDKAVSFASVARVTGLAGASLVQRYGSRDGMIRAALLAAWDGLDALTETAAAEAESAQGFLKALGGGTPGAGDVALLAADFRDAALRARAEAWRARVEALLTARLRDPEAAAILFAAWQGQALWQMAGGKGFRLKDAVKRLG
ncbi:transcriptional regulator [Paragemmobacter straminiformis]|uniref:Transcriptional regulator n=1 Tax=Paragemmobacter straminiformis TaxID=2045119 RepID=A0A842IG83_9RHOB|nr:transcriptional regulator [Gemmobacter straminiformis]MBC2837518.1 transcriptional regulator [Gemmobacter straminiformis]